MKIALYLRVSTDGQTLEPQEIELEQYCRARGWTISEKFRDTDSGAKRNREGLLALMEGVREKKFDGVAVVKIDRLARSLQHFATIIQELREYDVALIVTGQGIDTSKENSVSKVQMGILAVIAEFERDIISERTKAGLRAARARGAVLGKPSGKLVADPAPIVQAWRAETEGFNIRLLAEKLGGVSTATAWRIAKRVA